MQRQRAVTGPGALFTRSNKSLLGGKAEGERSRRCCESGKKFGLFLSFFVFGTGV
jgi:hypothetical protein